MAGSMFNPDIIDESPQYTVGALLFEDDATAWVYCKAAEDIAAHYCCGWVASYEANLIDLAQSNTFARAYFAGFPRVAIPSGVYGWFQVWGIGQMQVSASMAHGAFPYTTATAGELDDSASGQHRVRNCGTLEARGSTDGLVAAMFKFPAGDRIV